MCEGCLDGMNSNNDKFKDNSLKKNEVKTLLYIVPCYLK